MERETLSPNQDGLAGGVLHVLSVRDFVQAFLLLQARLRTTVVPQGLLQGLNKDARKEVRKVSGGTFVCFKGFAAHDMSGGPLAI